MRGVLLAPFGGGFLCFEMGAELGFRRAQLFAQCLEGGVLFRNGTSVQAFLIIIPAREHLVHREESRVPLESVALSFVEGSGGGHDGGS